METYKSIKKRAARLSKVLCPDYRGQREARQRRRYLRYCLVVMILSLVLSIVTIGIPFVWVPSK